MAGSLTEVCDCRGYQADDDQRNREGEELAKNCRESDEHIAQSGGHNVGSTDGDGAEDQSQNNSRQHP